MKSLLSIIVLRTCYEGTRSSKIAFLFWKKKYPLNKYLCNKKKFYALRHDFKKKNNNNNWVLFLLSFLTKSTLADPFSTYTFYVLQNFWIDFPFHSIEYTRCNRILNIILRSRLLKYKIWTIHRTLLLISICIFSWIVI